MLNSTFQMKNFLIILTFLFSIVSTQNLEATKADDNEISCSDLKRHEIENHLSTKTPYRVIANLDETPYQYEGCRPTRIWSVIRHGSRNPSKEIIERAQNDLINIKTKILEQNNHSLCIYELNQLRSWSFNVSADEEKFLVAEGEDELIELAERLQKRFPQLLPTNYHPSQFYFKYTKTQRTLKSAQSFATGLFGRNRINDIIYPEALHQDPVLRVGLRRKDSDKDIREA